MLSKRIRVTRHRQHTMPQTEEVISATREPIHPQEPAASLFEEALRYSSVPRHDSGLPAQGQAGVQIEYDLRTRTYRVYIPSMVLAVGDDLVRYSQVVLGEEMQEQIYRTIMMRLEESVGSALRRALSGDRGAPDY